MRDRSLVTSSEEVTPPSRLILASSMTSSSCKWYKFKRLRLSNRLNLYHRQEYSPRAALKTGLARIGSNGSSLNTCLSLKPRFSSLWPAATYGFGSDHAGDTVTWTVGIAEGSDACPFPFGLPGFRLAEDETLPNEAAVADESASGVFQL